MKRSALPQHLKYLILLSLTVFFSSGFPESRLFGQAATDTIQDTIISIKEKKGSIFSGQPGRALLLSLLIPGAGQISNDSYLRVPFVRAAVAGMGFIMIRTTNQYKCFREAYIDKIDGNPLTIPHYCDPVPFTQITPSDLENASAATIRELRDLANTNRQWAIVGFSVVWLLNGVDAFVDAHLKEFDIDEDLSIDIGPKMEDDPFAPMKMGVFVRF